MKQIRIFFLQQEVRKVSESIKYNHPLRKCVDTILKKVTNFSSSVIIVQLGGDVPAPGEQLFSIFFSPNIKSVIGIL